MERALHGYPHIAARTEAGLYGLALTNTQCRLGFRSQLIKRKPISIAGVGRKEAWYSLTSPLRNPDIKKSY